MASQHLVGSVTDIQGRPLQHNLLVNIAELIRGTATTKLLGFNQAGALQYVEQGAVASDGVSDHGELTGLGDDDHTQYVLRSILSASGDLFVRNGAVVDRLAVGSAGQVLGVSGGLPAWVNQSSIDHGSLGGLGDDDHTQYLLANGTRALTGNWNASLNIRAAKLSAGTASTAGNLSALSSNTVPGVFVRAGASAKEILFASQQSDTYSGSSYGWQISQDEVSTGDLFIDQIDGAVSQLVRFARGSDRVGINLSGGSFNMSQSGLEVGGFYFGHGGAYINWSQGSGTNYDFRASSSGELNMIFVSSTNNFLGMGGVADLSVYARAGLKSATGKMGLVVQLPASSDAMVMGFASDVGAFADGWGYGWLWKQDEVSTGDHFLYCRRGTGTDQKVMHFQRADGRIRIPARLRIGDDSDPGYVLDVLGSGRIGTATSTHLIFADATTDRVGINSDSPQVHFHVLHKGASTNSVVEVLRVQRDTTGTAANNIGVGIGMWVENANDIARAAANFDAVLTNVTNTSEDSDLRLKLYRNGSQIELMRWHGDLPGVRIENGVGGAPSALLDVRGSVIFNEDAASVDFRVEGLTDANLLFVDGSADSVGIGTNAPSAKFHVTGGDVLLRSSGTDAIFIDYAADQTIFGATSAVSNAVFEFRDTTGFICPFVVDRDQVTTNVMGHFYTVIDTSGGAVSVTLPATDTAGAGRWLVFKRKGGSNATISPAGSNTVEGAASYVLTADKQSVVLVSNGGSGASGDWEVVST